MRETKKENDILEYQNSIEMLIVKSFPFFIMRNKFVMTMDQGDISGYQNSIKILIVKSSPFLPREISL